MKKKMATKNEATKNENQIIIEEAHEEGVNDFNFASMCGGYPCHWLAPMVGQSEAAFRMLCRQYGTTLCSTPMIDPTGYVRSKEYRKEFPFFKEDRPLCVQFGSTDIKSLIEATRLVSPYCDAVEINCGCPQRCAKKGGYGSYLMENPDLLVSIVRELVKSVKVYENDKNVLDDKNDNDVEHNVEENNNIENNDIKRAYHRIGIFVKIRVFDDVAKTINLALRIQEAGADVITVHGRTRQQGGGKHQGDLGANWETIKEIKSKLKIPVVSNGNIRSFQDVQKCLSFTQCDGVMSACGLLADPTLFSPNTSSSPTPSSSTMVGSSVSVSRPPSIQIAIEYLKFAEKYQATYQQVTKHLITYLNPLLKNKHNKKSMNVPSLSDPVAKKMKHNDDAPLSGNKNEMSCSIKGEDVDIDAQIDKIRQTILMWRGDIKQNPNTFQVLFESLTLLQTLLFGK